jgi:biopolymer transport protein ExbD
MIRMVKLRHDPHAHVIRAPGRRLLQATPLRFVHEKVTGRGRRAPSASLNLVSFIDFLVVTVIFLLMSFSASGEVPDRSVEVPDAINGTDMIDAPIVTVTGNQILVDGALAGSWREIEETGRPQRLDELFHVLKAKRELFVSVEPNRAFHGTCLLQIDKDVPAAAVKSVFQTAAFAGYPNVSFMTRKAPEPGP